MRYKYFNPCRYRNSQKSLMQKSSAKILWWGKSRGGNGTVMSLQVCPYLI
ncbi:hypothetical protein DEO72_LG3g2191 [Vigna unguiculata]|uniref:Uncharacterized protein n=1 Tax=Vigna unguiculata TaxID=3917 RepID=A0A4D6LG86_VIGUN|nr:hypothetical protein DEO72_LG3g2191 [Vigna unguiculata]